LIFALFEYPDGVSTDEDERAVVYDLERNDARIGQARTDHPALVWRLDESLVAQSHKGGLCALSVEIDLAGGDWLYRCDRVDFPPGGIAYRHVHPGPGIRRLLHGELTIERDGVAHKYSSGESWLEAANDPVLATASPNHETAFVRVLLLPAEWAGKRTIRYLDAEDENKPRLQRATVFLEEPIKL
jgi:quercetin dioxygenase-like cupin family protein